jgi:cytochrome c oxidase subunit 2
VNIPSNIITLIIGIALTLISLWYGQHHGLMPVAASEEANQVDGIFNLMMTIATGLFLLIEGILIYAIFKFRRREGDRTDGPAIEGNVPLEILWTSIPTVIVFILAIYSFEVYNNMGGLDPMASHDHGTKIAHHQQGSLLAFAPDRIKVALGLGISPITDPEEEPPLVVNVNGIQYAWIFTYPETGIVSGDMHIPLGHPVQINISAGDVLHAFWLPEFRLKQDAVPGRDAELVFTPNRVGQYPIICAELCGAFHGGMKTTLYVQTQEDYDQWVLANAPKKDEPLDKAVAVSSTPLSDEEFLVPYAQAMGVDSRTLAQLHSSHHHHSAPVEEMSLK